MKLIILLFVILFSLFSCSNKKQYPEFISEKVSLENINLNQQLPVFTSFGNITSELEGLDKLVIFQHQFLQKEIEFNLKEFKNSWNNTHNKNDFKKANCEDLKLWFEVTGLLLELTGETFFAVEMERIILLGVGKTVEETKKIVAPFVFTKNTDNLFINLFNPATIHYNHTTKGKVKVEMETNFPHSGKVELKFNMTKRRYIEVNIRIPEWAENTIVTVKKVKYVAPPGGYCKIAKKWKEGDLIEIEFQMENMPEYLKH